MAPAFSRNHKKTAIVFTLLVSILMLVVFFTFTLEHNDAVRAKKASVVVKVHQTVRYGKILVTPEGFTLYTYNADTKNHSNCFAFCLQMWPPSLYRADTCQQALTSRAWGRSFVPTASDR